MSARPHFGATLRAARERAGVSLVDAAWALREAIDGLDDDEATTARRALEALEACATPEAVDDLDALGHDALDMLERVYQLAPGTLDPVWFARECLPYALCDALLEHPERWPAVRDALGRRDPGPRDPTGVVVAKARALLTRSVFAEVVADPDQAAEAQRAKLLALAELADALHDLVPDPNTLAMVWTFRSAAGHGR